MSARWNLFAVCLAAVLAATPPLAAQQGQQIVQGVYIDGKGVLNSVRLIKRPSLLRGREPALNEDVRRSSAQRKISLTRLERLWIEHVKNRSSVPDEMRYLAGLYRIDYVVVDPASGEVIIVGPAEGWIVLNDGTAIGARNRELILKLDDLIAALRAFPPGCPPQKAVWCSIDPTEEGRRRLRAALAQIRQPVNRGQIRRLAAVLKQAFGPHRVVVSGVPRECGIAFKMVGADYAMKAVAMGVVRPGVRGLRSYVEMVPLRQAGTVKVQRWWFVPDENLLSCTEDKTVWKLSSRRVRLLGDSDFQIRTSGEQDPFHQPDPWNRRFAEQFTRSFPKLKSRLPVLDALENVFDLLTLAVILEHGGAAALVNWDRSGFLDEDAYSLRSYPTPEYAETLVNIRVSGTRLTTPLGGARYGSNDVLGGTFSGDVERPPISIPDDPNRWWWD